MGHSFTGESVKRLEGRNPEIRCSGLLRLASSNARLAILQQQCLLNQRLDRPPFALVEKHVLDFATVAVVAFHETSKGAA